MTLHNEQDAIKQAVEAGYKLPTPCEYDGIVIYHRDETFSDPAFWQALGKARGWRGMSHYDTDKAEWEYFALRYFETKLSGGDTSKFFQELP